MPRNTACANLSPEERLRALAQLLAAGVERLHQRGIRFSAEKKSADEGLEVSRKTRLSVQRG